jgi:phage regulator Rha-like protein
MSAPKTEAPTVSAAQGFGKQTSSNRVDSGTDGGTLVLTAYNDEARLDSRLLAGRLGVQHQSLFELVKKHRADFEQLGKVRFETGASSGSRTGQSVKFARLNEDQCYLLLTYSRNNRRVLQLKLALVKAFRDARSAADLHRVEYLPGYHQLHDGIQALAAGSPNERFVHQNVNKLINKVAGLAAGERRTAPVPQQAMLIMAQTLAAQAMRGAQDHHEGYQRAKSALQCLAALTQAPGADAGLLHHEQ